MTRSAESLHSPTMLRTRTFAALMALALAAPSPAGPLDWLTSKFHKSISPGIVEARLRAYLKAVLQNPRLRVSHGRAELTGAERKRLDPKVLERLGDAGDVVVADVAGGDASGLAILASKDIEKPDWDPATSFLGYVVLSSPAVFPGDADRALSLCAHLIGEPALYGNAPEAGPVWLKKEPGGGGGGRGGGGGGRGGRGARFSGAESFGADGDYQPRPGEVSPDEDEIPAWVTRGVATVPLGANHRPTQLGLLIALTRGPGGHGVTLTHVAGAGPAGKPLFKGLHEPEVVPLRPERR